MLVAAIGLIMLFQEGESFMGRRRQDSGGKASIEVSRSKWTYSDMSMSRHHTLLCIYI